MEPINTEIVERRDVPPPPEMPEMWQVIGYFTEQRKWGGAGCFETEGGAQERAAGFKNAHIFRLAERVAKLERQVSPTMTDLMVTPESIDTSDCPIEPPALCKEEIAQKIIDECKRLDVGQRLLDLLAMYEQASNPQPAPPPLDRLRERVIIHVENMDINVRETVYRILSEFDKFQKGELR